MNFNELYPKKKEYYNLLMDIKTTAECNVSNCVIDKQKAKLLMRYINKKEKKIKMLNNIINELNATYCKVITKCEEMIDNRFYMNDIAIKKYADEIKDICKYYVGEAKELKGNNNENNK